MLAVDRAELQRFDGMLSGEERARASRYRFDRDRQHYIVRRGRLRELLARELGCRPREVPISFNRFGKPELSGQDLSFNLSHSAGLALYVIAHGVAIGCDIEWRRPGMSGADVAEHFFSALERRLLADLPAAQRQEGFFNCWTRKEAYLKARGLGLTPALDSFAVSLAPGEPAALLQAADEANVGRWSFLGLIPAQGLHVAIAAPAAWHLAEPLGSPPVRRRT